ncbi:TPA: hypothetical protein ACH3X1_002844 [Trebouxia sp. C0004]
MYSAAPFVCSLAITNSSFSNNTVPLNGGAFASRFDGYAVAIILSTFTSNQITPAGGPGAAFSMTPMITAGDLSTLLVISQSNFTGNVASDALGCLSVQQDACVAIQSCIFASNTASTGGATFTTQVNSDESNCFNQALALQTIPRPLPDAPALFDPLNPGPAPEAAPEGSSEPEAAPEPFSPVILDIRGSQFLNNSATGTTGGALALGSVISAAAIVNCTFVSNASPDVGGAITIFSNSLVTIAGTSFVANQAPSSKRVVYHFSQPVGGINGSRCVNNSAGATGARAIYIESLSRLLLNDCELVNNTSLLSGGAIQRQARILPASFCRESLHTKLGVFMAAHVAAGWISCYVAILDCTVQRNAKTSTQPGASFDDLQGSGRVIWTNAPLLWIHNSSFVGNAAATLGGAVLYIATALPADSEHLEYEYRAEAEYPSPEDSLIHSAINAAQVKNSSSFIMSAAHLAAQQLQTQLNASSSLVPAAASRLCASWIEGQNSSPGYGHLMALPAQQVHVTCSNAIGSSDEYMCQSSLEVNSTAVTNFWSTNSLDMASGSAASRLLLQAGIQDGFGQVVTAGLYMCYAVITLLVDVNFTQEKWLSAYSHLLTAWL